MLVPLLLLALAALPIVELALLIRIGGAVGALPTILLVLATGVLGVALARWQGLRAMRQIQEQLARGAVPGRELFDAALIALAGLLLLTPGVVTDGAGFLLLVPPVRALLARGARRWASGRFTVVHGGAGTGPGGRPPGPGDVIDVTGSVRDAASTQAGSDAPRLGAGEPTSE